MGTICFFGLFLLSLAILGRRWWRRKKASSRSSSLIPPGERGWPIVGETLAYFKPRLVGRRGDFIESRISRYGKIFTAKLLGKVAVVSTDAETNRYLLNGEGRFMELGWSSSFRRVMGEYSISMLVGEEHRHMRSILLGFLGTVRLRTVFLRHAEDVAEAVVRGWRDGDVVSVHDEAVKFSFNIMMRETLSMSPDNPEFNNLINDYVWFTKGLMSFPINVPGTTYWKALKSTQRIMDVIEGIMEERSVRKASRGEGEEDLLWWAMKNTTYSREKIKNMVLHTLFAGHETTSKAISLMVYFVGNCPRALEQLREEHLQVVSSRVVQEGENMELTWDDYKGMEFTRCVINETLRLGNVVGSLFKQASVDIKLKEFVIPKGSTVVPNLSSVHLDPDVFENPDQFDPWRWLDLPGRRSSCFMPFGGGLRLCVGVDLARLEMMVFLRRLVLGFNWEATEPDHPMNSGIVKFHKGLPVKVTRRAAVVPRRATSGKS